MKDRQRKLTKKQKRFVAEYQKDLNGTQAAIKAGYSPKNADVIGPRLVGKSWVLEAIKKQTEERLHKVGVQADKESAYHLTYTQKYTCYGSYSEGGRGASP